MWDKLSLRSGRFCPSPLILMMMMIDGSASTWWLLRREKTKHVCASGHTNLLLELKTILIAALSCPFHIDNDNDNDERQNRKLRYLLQTSHCRFRRYRWPWLSRT
jgi:hypothetical protein